MKLRHNTVKQAGITVVELMVGLLLSLLLIAGVLQVYLGSSTTYSVTEGLSRLQENTHTSSDMLAKEIRMAGYVPCSQPQNSVSVINASASDWWAPMFQQPIRGYEGESDTSGFPADIVTTAKAGSDALVIMRGGNKVAGIKLYDQASNEFILQRDVAADWVEDGSLMIACDVTHARLFQAANIGINRIEVEGVGTSAVPGNNNPIGHAFGSDGQLTNYAAAVYYVRESSAGDGYSLYRRYLNVNASGENRPITEELAEGIENMQLLYGYDSDGDGNAERYLKASDVIFTTPENWRNVASVKIGLLYASENGLRNSGRVDDTVYMVGNTPIGINTTVTHAEDRRKRYVASMTVSLRNM